MKIKKKNFLLTGGTGLLASSWGALCSNKYNITLGTNKRLIRSKKINIEQITLENSNILEKKLKKGNYNFVIHTAGLTDVDYCENHPKEANKINYEYTKNLANICKKLDIYFIYISTDHLFDGKNKHYSEYDKCNPLNLYSLSKYNSEQYIKKNLIKFLIIRTNFFGFGPNYRKSFSDIIIENLRNGSKIFLTKNIFFSPISIEYLIKYSMKLINKNLMGVFNISSNERISKFDFGKKLAKYFDLETKLISSEKFKKSNDIIAKRPTDMSLSNHKIKKKLKINIPSIDKQIRELRDKKPILKNFFSYCKPYGQHYVDDKDIREVVKVLKSPFLTQGPNIEKFEKSIADYVGSRYAVAVSSCTAGLHIAGTAAGIKNNTKAVTSPITFVSTANAIKYNGGKVLLADIDLKDINIDPVKLKGLISKEKNIKAVFPVHFAGFPAKMKTIYNICKKQNIVIIEDAAHALGSKYPNGEMVGSCKFSDMCVFSLHPVKSIAAGEGGVITTNDDKYYRKLLRLRSHGINKLDDNFQNQEFSKTNGLTNPWYHEMQSLGFHYRITDIQCALANSQLKKLDKFINKRKKLSKIYDKAFKNSKKFKPVLNDNKDLSSRHIYILKINFKKLKMERSEIMVKLFNAGVGTQIHYLPITEHPYYKNKFSKKAISELQNTYKYYEQCITIPLYFSLSYKEQKKIIHELNNL